MKRIFLGIIIVILLLVISFTCIGCYSFNGPLQDDNDEDNNDDKRDDRLYTDYLEYFIFDGEITILGSTKLGIEQGYLVIPDEIDGRPVRYIYDLWLGYHWDESCQDYRNKVKKVFVTKNLKGFMNSLMNDKNTKFVIISKDRPDNPNRYPYYISRFHEEFYGDVEIANISYLYNYEEAPNANVYFVDDLEVGESILCIPDTPTREGYIFTGWYTDGECTQKIDLNTFVYNTEMNYIDFYAGWQKIVA